MKQMKQKAKQSKSIFEFYFKWLKIMANLTQKFAVKLNVGDIESISLLKTMK